MIELQNIPIATPIIFGVFVVLLFFYISALRKYKGQTQALLDSENSIEELQKSAREIKKRKEELSNIFRFTPDLISKLASYHEERDIFEMIINGIEYLLRPVSSYIFIEKEEHLVAAVLRDPSIAKGRPKCAKTKGMLGVAYELRKTIDMDDLKTLTVERQKMMLQNPFPELQIQVCAPICYMKPSGSEEFYGIIALSGIPNYSREKKNIVTMLSDLTAISIVNSKLLSRFKHQATRDPLTDLSNKRAFLDAISKAEIKETRDKGLYSVFMFDIDHFKTYNDKNGHQAGDEALKITAKLIKESFRSGDVKARYGGEEFIVLMNGATKEQAYTVAERFRAKVEEYPYPHEKNQPKGILTISGGVATFPEDATNSNILIEKADEALYQAKESGRNSVGKAQSVDFSEGIPPMEQSVMK
jgi:diguanylate cyclase (GGDEF)-like protein